MKKQRSSPDAVAGGGADFCRGESSLCLKCRLLIMINKTLEIVCRCTQAGSAREKGMTCGYGWVRFKLTALTSPASHTQTILLLLLNLCCWEHHTHFLFSLPPPTTYPPSLILLCQECVRSVPHVQWHLTKCRDCFAAYWTQHFSIPTLHVIKAASTH